MEAAIINPFVEATLEVTTSMAQMKAEVGKPCLKTGNEAYGEVSGFIELNSPKSNGTLALSFSRDALFSIYQKMLGEEITSIDASALDLAAEITNMVCGGAKQRLADEGYDFQLTQPSVLSGQSHNINHAPDKPVIVLPLEFSSGKVFIEICL